MSCNNPNWENLTDNEKEEVDAIIEIIKKMSDEEWNDVGVSGEGKGDENQPIDNKADAN